MLRLLWMTAPVLLPLAGGLFLLAAGEDGDGKKRERNRLLFTEAVVLLSSVLVWSLILSGKGKDDAVLFYLAGRDLKVFFRLDGAGCVFAGLVSFLWPLATLYASEYMEGEERQKSFFAFYTMAYGVTLGIAFAGNLVTLYLFYELLTLVTFPLVLHYRNRESRAASRKYLYYSIGGAAFAFMGLVFILIYGNTADFILGGVLNQGVPGFRTNTILFMYVLAFFGFGVKAALVPVHGFCGADAGDGPAPCGGRGEVGGFCDPPSDLLQLRRGFYPGDLGPLRGPGGGAGDDRVRVDHGRAGGPSETAAGLLDHQ